MRERHERLREAALLYLGGKCIECGETDNLEIDHIDARKKKLPSWMLWRLSWKKRKKELDKCQLLCHKDHRKKTTKERGQISLKNSHGRYSTYIHNKCRCELCSEARRAYSLKVKHLALT